MSRRILIAAALVTLVLAGFAGAAKKQKPKNGDFETGDLSRWQSLNLDAEPEERWYAYSGTDLPGASLRPMARRGGAPTTFFAPPQGEFAAVTAGGSAARILHRVLKLKKDYKHKLKMRLYWENRAGEFASPDSLDANGGFDNQQYRVDVLRKNAPLDSVDEDDVLKEVFGTQPGDPASQPPMRVSVNLSRFDGKKVRLRLAEVDNLFYFNAAVDAVKLKSKPKN